MRCNPKPNAGAKGRADKCGRIATPTPAATILHMVSNPLTWTFKRALRPLKDACPLIWRIKEVDMFMPTSSCAKMSCKRAG
mgnify:FL=1